MRLFRKFVNGQIRLNKDIWTQFCTQNTPRVCIEIKWTFCPFFSQQRFIFILMWVRNNCFWPQGPDQSFKEPGQKVILIKVWIFPASLLARIIIAFMWFENSSIFLIRVSIFWSMSCDVSLAV